jgi:release factor glutamine methyltransferase
MSLNLVQAWKGARARLEAAGLSGPVIDARLLVEAAADATRTDIVTHP